MEYGDKRDYRPINIFLDGVYTYTTTWCKTQAEARKRACKALGLTELEINRVDSDFNN